MLGERREDGFGEGGKLRASERALVRGQDEAQRDAALAFIAFVHVNEGDVRKELSAYAAAKRAQRVKVDGGGIDDEGIVDLNGGEARGRRVFDGCVR